MEDLANLFGEKVATLVEGLTKIKTVLDNEDKAQQKSMQAENFKRILLTLNDDVRVVLIKLADRLHNCRTIEYMPEHKRDKILSETMFVFIPLAHRLGLYGIKSEMEDIWLRYKEPEAFNEITAKINRNVIDKDKEINDFIAPIDQALQKAGFKYEIKKRVKTPYSIWNKMNKKGIDFEEIYDLYAVRIIFDPGENTTETERDQCYHIFSIITGMYRYKADRVRDWVNYPKNNGYEALHCTLMSRTGIWIEVQIRSIRMNEVAEKGIAAHWAYKKDGFASNESQMDKWITKVKEILVNECGWVAPDESNKALHTSCKIEKCKDHTQFVRFYHCKSKMIPFSALEFSLASKKCGRSKEEMLYEMEHLLGFSLEEIEEIEEKKGRYIPYVNECI